MELIVAGAIGVAIGALTGLVPGLHVNLLAALLLATPGIGPEAAVAILCIGVVHTFVTILPTTYLGAPADGLSVLPAHRLLRTGAASEAVALSLAASLLAAVLACLIAWPMGWVLRHPATLPFLHAAAPWILVAIPVALVVLDARPIAAAITLLLAAALGHIAWGFPVQGVLPGSPLLPLLSGLFGVPTLMVAMRQRMEPPPDRGAPPELAAGTTAAALKGTGAALLTSALPGMTAAVAGALAMPRHGDARRALAVLSAVNTAHLVLSLFALWSIGRTRSGLAIAWNSLRPASPWLGGIHPEILLVSTTILASAVAAVLATHAARPSYARVVKRLGPGRAEATAVAIIVALVAATTGWLGSLLLVAAATVGHVPLRLGCRRLHLAGALSIPIAIRLASG